MNNEDLAAIEKEIAERKELATAGVSSTVPTISFDKPLAPAPEKIEPPKDTAGQLVESAFNQAIVHRVTTDETVQTELLDSAKKVIENKTNAIRERADQEDKEAFFNNKKGACECFGYNEATTEKWAVKIMSLWHNVMTAIWIFFGFFTFAPITFVAKKITVIFKKSWIAFTVAILIYLFIVLGIPLLTTVLKK